jgi:hypothetical protein
MSFHSFVEVENPHTISGPPAALHKPIRQGLDETPDLHELDHISSGPKLDGSRDVPAVSPIPATPTELELSRPPSPQAHEAVEALQSFSR